MKLGIFAKTFSRPTIEELLQSIASCGIHSVQFNLTCARLEPLPKHVPSELAQRIADSAEQATVELSASPKLHRSPDIFLVQVWSLL